MTTEKGAHFIMKRVLSLLLAVALISVFAVPAVVADADLISITLRPGVGSNARPLPAGTYMRGDTFIANLYLDNPELKNIGSVDKLHVEFASNVLEWDIPGDYPAHTPFTPGPICEGGDPYSDSGTLTFNPPHVTNYNDVFGDDYAILNFDSAKPYNLEGDVMLKIAFKVKESAPLGRMNFTLTINGFYSAGTESASAHRYELGTDYTINVPAAHVLIVEEPDVRFPIGLTASVGQTLADVLPPFPANPFGRFPDHGSASVPGTFTWTAAPDTSVGAAGAQNHNVTFTPDDLTRYTPVTRLVRVYVNNIPGRVDPIVTWPEGFTAIPGQTLGQVLPAGSPGIGITVTGSAICPNDGVTVVPGTFMWTPGNDGTLGSSLPVGPMGTRLHNVTFTPDDLTLYNVMTMDVTVNVQLGITLPSPRKLAIDRQLNTSSLPPASEFGTWEWEYPARYWTEFPVGDHENYFVYPTAIFKVDLEHRNLGWGTASFIGFNPNWNTLPPGPASMNDRLPGASHVNVSNVAVDGEIRVGVQVEIVSGGSVTIIDARFGAYIDNGAERADTITPALPVGMPPEAVVAASGSVEMAGIEEDAKMTIHAGIENWSRMVEYITIEPTVLGRQPVRQGYEFSHWTLRVDGVVTALVPDPANSARPTVVSELSDPQDPESALVFLSGEYEPYKYTFMVEDVPYELVVDPIRSTATFDMPAASLEFTAHWKSFLWGDLANVGVIDVRAVIMANRWLVRFVDARSNPYVELRGDVANVDAIDVRTVIRLNRWLVRFDDSALRPNP
jgi:hypothetical protein